MRVTFFLLGISILIAVLITVIVLVIVLVAVLITVAVLVIHNMLPSSLRFAVFRYSSIPENSGFILCFK